MIPHPQVQNGSRVPQALRHVMAAGLLGTVAGFLGAPVMIASLFGGWLTALAALAVVTGVVSAAAVALDVALGPHGGDRTGSILRGITLGVLGTTAAAVLGVAALRLELYDGIPVPVRFAAAALPFAALAALQWRGAVRIATAVLLVVTAAVVGIPRGQEAAQQARVDEIVTEVGTTAHPWVTRIEGLESAAPQTTGSGYLWSPYQRPGGTVVVHLLRMPDEVVLLEDPCAAPFYTPGGDFPVTSCTPSGDGTWRRDAEGYWQQLVRRVDGTWLGATADPDVPERLLAEALDNARPMTDDEYDAWLQEILPGRDGY